MLLFNIIFQIMIKCFLLSFLFLLFFSGQAWVKGSTWIPIFDVDVSIDMQTLAKKITNFVMGITSINLISIQLINMVHA